MGDLRHLKPVELARLLNSSPLGAVVSERQLHRHRTRAGLRLGNGSAVDLFRDEYRLPLPHLMAPLAAGAEHLFPLLLLAGLGTRFSALALLGMTLTIQLFVYPDAYPTHGTWAALLLYLVAQGPGKISIDAWFARRWG